MSHHHHSHDKEFSGHCKTVAELVEKYDDPSRDEWQKPEEILDILELKPNEKIADIGAGTGYFSIRAAKRLEKGIVYAIDSEPERLRYLENRADSLGLLNVRTLHLEENSIELPELVDVILLVNTYHHINDRKEYFANLKHWLSPKGRLVIVEGKIGTPMEPPEEFRLAEDQILVELTDAGYFRIVDSSLLPYQSLQIFKIKTDE